MRPLYERQHDRVAEERVATLVEPLFGKAIKLPKDYRADFVFMLHGAAHFFAEVKCRTRLFDPYWIGLKKWMALRSLAAEVRRQSLIIVQWPESLGYVPVNDRVKLNELVWGGRKDRGDPEDMEVMVQIPVRNFIPL